MSRRDIYVREDISYGYDAATGSYSYDSVGTGAGAGYVAEPGNTDAIPDAAKDVGDIVKDYETRVTQKIVRLKSKPIFEVEKKTSRKGSWDTTERWKEDGVYYHSCLAAKNILVYLETKAKNDRLKKGPGPGGVRERGYPYGGMGYVKRARLQRGAETANKVVKILFPSTPEPESCLKNAFVMGLLGHDYLVLKRRIKSESYRYYLVMESLGSLDVFETFGAKTDKPPPEWTHAKKLSALLKALSQLQTMHCHGILHRDLKAENLVVSEDDCFNVIDFDLIGRYGERTSEEIGTPVYFDKAAFAKETQHFGRDLHAFKVLLGELFNDIFSVEYKHELGKETEVKVGTNKRIESPRLKELYLLLDSLNRYPDDWELRRWQAEYVHLRLLIFNKEQLSMDVLQQGGLIVLFHLFQSNLSTLEEANALWNSLRAQTNKADVCKIIETIGNVVESLTLPLNINRMPSSYSRIWCGTTGNEKDKARAIIADYGQKQMVLGSSRSKIKALFAQFLTSIDFIHPHPHHQHIRAAFGYIHARMQFHEVASMLFLAIAITRDGVPDPSLDRRLRFCANKINMIGLEFLKIKAKASIFSNCLRKEADVFHSGSAACSALLSKLKEMANYHVWRDEVHYTRSRSAHDITLSIEPRLFQIKFAPLGSDEIKLDGVESSHEASPTSITITNNEQSIISDAIAYIQAHNLWDGKQIVVVLICEFFKNNIELERTRDVLQEIWPLSMSNGARTTTTLNQLLMGIKHMCANGIPDLSHLADVFGMRSVPGLFSFPKPIEISSEQSELLQRRRARVHSHGF